MKPLTYCSPNLLSLCMLLHAIEIVTVIPGDHSAGRVSECQSSRGKRKKLGVTSETGIIEKHYKMKNATKVKKKFSHLATRFRRL